MHWGPQVHRADATTPEGRSLVLDENVRYVESSFGLFFTNIINWGGTFAVNVTRTETGADSSEVSYRALNEGAAESFGLVPQKNWWAMNGRWILLGILAAACLPWLIARMKKQPST